MLSKIKNALGLAEYGPKSDSEARKLQNSNRIANTRCGCYESKYKVSPDKEENASGYGVWRSIERGVKRFLNDPGEAVTNEWKEIKREAKETGTEAGLEMAMRYLAHKMKVIDDEHKKCVQEDRITRGRDYDDYMNMKKTFINLIKGNEKLKQYGHLFNF